MGKREQEAVIFHVSFFEEEKYNENVMWYCHIVIWIVISLDEYYVVEKKTCAQRKFQFLLLSKLQTYWMYSVYWNSREQGTHTRTQEKIKYNQISSINRCDTVECQLPFFWMIDLFQPSMVCQFVHHLEQHHWLKKK